MFISLNIRYLYKKLKLSQNEFGELFELKNGVISSYVSEKAIPTIPTIQKICKYFEITIDDFVGKDLSRTSTVGKKKSRVSSEDQTTGEAFTRLIDTMIDKKIGDTENLLYAVLSKLDNTKTISDVLGEIKKYRGEEKKV